MNDGSKIPWTLKAGAAAVAGGSLAVLGVTFADHWEALVVILVGGVVVVGSLLLIFRLILKTRDRRKADDMLGIVTSPRRNRELTDPEEIAKVADLTSKFQEGIKIYQAAGKNIYSLPWYLLVGEPGSGKTEMLRHCGIDSPLGDLPGVGGTINMNWWFTHQAVVLDTAGRIMFQQVEAGRTNEWKAFLELLAKVRPNCPINGLMLVIPAESLIRDNQNKVEEKARKIARQFDLIQRTLDIRFPVFIVITKADLINGFRSFFDGVSLADAWQMLGWSNPATQLDAPFDPEEVEHHLARVKDRLLKRRTGLLLNPVNTEDPSKRRTDQVDDLYGFPDALMTIAPRLSLYLQTIFVTSEWSPKPLFLRGIYFTSSMRQGASLDTDLATALGVPVDALPEGRVWDAQRPFFLRDLFMRKIFPEKGLVTREVKADGLHWRRRAAVLAAGFVGVTGLLGLTIYGQQQMEKSILAPQDWWKSFASGYAKHLENAQKNNASQTRGNWYLIQEQDGKYVYRGDRKAFDSENSPITLITMHRQAVGEKQNDDGEVFRKLDVPLVFRASAIGEANLALQERREAYQTVIEQTLLIPLLDAVRGKMKNKDKNNPREFVLPKVVATTDNAAPTDRATEIIQLFDSADRERDALKQLMHIEALAEGTSGDDDDNHRPIELMPLFRYILDLDKAKKDELEKLEKDVLVLQKAVRLIYDENQKFPPLDPTTKQPVLGNNTLAISDGIARHDNFWVKFASTKELTERPNAASQRLIKAIEEFANKEAEIAKGVSSQPANVSAYQKLSIALRNAINSMDRAATDADKLLADATLKDLVQTGKKTSFREFVEKEQNEYLSQRIDRAFKDLISEAKLIKKLEIKGVPLEKVLVKAHKDARAVIPPLDSVASAQLDDIQSNYLWRDREDVKEPAYHAYFRLLRKTVDRMPDLNSPASASELDKPVDGVVISYGDASDSHLKSLKSEVPIDGPHSETVLEICRNLETSIIVPALGYRVVAAAASMLPKTKAEMESLVARSAPEGQLREVPLTAFKGGAIKREYNPLGAQKPLASYAGLVALLEATGGNSSSNSNSPTTQSTTKPVLAAQSFVEQLRIAKTAAVDPYLADFGTYWLGVVRSARQIEPGKPDSTAWTEFASRLPASAASANDALQAVSKSAGIAFTLLLSTPSSGQNKDAYQREALAVGATTVDAEAQRTSVTVLDRWKKLPAGDVSAASAVAEQVGQNEFFKNYMMSKGSLTADYWAGITYRGLSLLGKSQADAKLRRAGKVFEAYNLFPAAARRPNSKDLSVDEIGKGVQDIDTFLNRVLQRRQNEASAAGLPTDFTSAFAKLCPDLPTPAEETSLRRLRQTLSVCVKGGKVGVETILRDEQTARMGVTRVLPLNLSLIRLGEPNALLWPPDGAQKHPEIQPQTGDWQKCYPKAQADRATLGSLLISGEATIGVRFEQAVAAGQRDPRLDDPIVVRGPWAAIQLLRELKATPDPEVPDADGLTSIWLVELNRPDFPAQGSTASVCVRLRFPAPLPKDLVTKDLGAPK